MRCRTCVHACRVLEKADTPFPALQRSSGSFKAFGPPLRYPSCDNSPQASWHRSSLLTRSSKLIIY